MVVGLSHGLVLAALLFVLGCAGVLIRRNIIVVMMSIELMLNAANLALVSGAWHHGAMAGQTAAFFVMILAAAEAAVGLAIVVILYRWSGQVAMDHFQELKG